MQHNSGDFVAGHMHCGPSGIPEVAGAEKRKLAAVPRLTAKPINTGYAVLFFLKHKAQRSAATTGPPLQLCSKT